MSAPIVLGIDLGTSAVKVVALGSGGTLLAESSATFDTTSSVPLQAEQDPADWLTATSDAMGSMGDALKSAGHDDWQSRVDAVGLTGQLPTLVCLSDGKVVGRAITWKDGRADEWAASRLDAAGRKKMHAQTGMPVDGRYLAPMLQFHFKDRLDEIQTILSAKDFLLHALTGVKLTDPSTASGYGIYDLGTQRFNLELAQFWGVPSAVLPGVRPADAAAGQLTPSGAKLLGLHPGVLVNTGAADSVCASYAMAGLNEAVVAISFGSSAVIVGAAHHRMLDPKTRYLTTPHVSAGWYGREMDLLASGTGYEWLSQLFGWAGGELDRHAADSTPGANGLTFTPYLAGGEQGALWNPHLFGAMMGLSLKHSRDDMARAFLEGVFFEIRRCIEVLAETSPVASLWVSGNLVRSPKSLQMLADIVQRPIESYRHKSPAAVGAAILASAMTTHAIGVERPAAADMTRPNAALSADYSDIYQRYLARANVCQ